MRTTFIYALTEPKTEEIRYIGKSDVPKDRLKQHIRTGRRGRSLLNRWLRGIQDAGMSPGLLIIDEINYEEWGPAEAAYIEFYRECGLPLVNTSDGGDCGPCMAGKKQTVETKLKISSSLRGHRHSPETKLKISLSLSGENHFLFGKQLPVATRIKLSVANAGKKRSREQIERMAATKRGKKQSTELIAKRSAALRGVPWSAARRMAQDSRRKNAS